MSIVITLCIAALGGFLFNLLNIPLAWLLGSMFLVAINCRSIPSMEVPKNLRLASTAILGTAVGALVDKDILSIISMYASSISVMLLCQVMLTILGAWFFLKRTSTDRLSAFFASFPGAISQITALSLENKCDSGMIAMNHTCRIFIVIAFIPLAIAAVAGGGNSSDPTIFFESSDSIDGYIWPALIAIAGYMIGKRFISITPILYGPMLLAAALSISGLLPEARIGEWLIIAAQIVIGASVGLRLKKFDLSQSKRLTRVHLPCALILLAFTLVVSFLVHLLLGIPMATALLIMAPGGLSEMVLIAYTLDIDPVMVTTHHVVRSLFSLLLIPWVMNHWVKSNSEKSNGHLGVSKANLSQ